MSDLILRSSLPVPSPKEQFNIRLATMDDLPFVDALHKKYGKNLGFAPRKMLEGKIKLEEMLIAESATDKLGYLIGQDRYFKHDNVGIIYHLVVSESKQRGFVGASLLKAQFERSAIGCKLYCCWCAQDIAANNFWESMGFIPIAYRAGSEAKERTHIFWQKRIRENDTTTPYWYPYKTAGGSLREERIVLPIQPGTHWGDKMPLILPQEIGPEKQLEEPKANRTKPKKEIKSAEAAESISQFGFKSFASEIKTVVKKEKPKRSRKPKAKTDPRLLLAARELRDRWIDQQSPDNSPVAVGKYDLRKRIETPVMLNMPLLEAA